jgi:3-deoxy-D-manno-octulosonic-acid transferase
MTVSSFGLNRSERFVLAAYDLLMRILQPMLRRKLHQRAKHEPDYGLNVAQRFGLYEGSLPTGGFVWLHAVSLGETRAAALLLPALRESMPGMRLVLTHSTATGLVQGRGLLQPGDIQIWLPWDTAQATGQFLAHFRPCMGLLMETEVWPNLVQACRNADVPLCLINARMSEKSWLKAKRWPLLSGPAYRGLSSVLAQTPTDAQRFLALGCQSVEVAGNIKFDVAISTQAQSVAARWQRGLSSRFVVMLASSRVGEELLWLQCLKSSPERLAQLKARKILWFVVPRHPQRFDEVHALLEQAGLRCQRRSEWGDLSPDPSQFDQVDVVLGDSLGEMHSYYLVSKLALLGGSFEPLGGQNLIEAAACSCPVIMGPHTFNFSEAAELAETHGAAMRVQDMGAALDRVVFVMDHPQELKKSQLGAVQLLENGRGAVARHVHCLREKAREKTAEGQA